MQRALIALFVAIATAAAQAPDAQWSNVKTLAAGTEIRISTAGSGSVKGKVESVTDTSLAVNTKGSPRSIDRREIKRVWVKTKAHRKRSTLIGLAIGAAAAGAVGGSIASDCSDNLCSGHGAAVIFASIGLGGAIGAAIGASVAHSGWRQIYRQ